MLAEIEQFIAWVGCEARWRTLADVAGSAEIQSAGLADACFAVFLSGYATQCYEMMKELHIG